ncbi:MAG: GDSL family lipase [Verrucomicrobia bacterium]|nr:GDSL family lipase [Verrucomicrobiota bacterium]
MQWRHAMQTDAATPWPFEEEIRAFELQAMQAPPPHGAIVCTGSSTMRCWRDNLAQDLAPLTVIPRGFGGSTMEDALHFVDRIVIACKPRAVVLYEGDNDIGKGTAPDAIMASFHAFVERVHKGLAGARIYVLSIKPSIKRWSLWPVMEETNRLLAAACSRNKLLTYVDVASGMLDATGKPRAELFLADMLHMTRAGYLVWRDALRPVLLKAEQRFESQPPAKPA